MGNDTLFVVSVAVAAAIAAIATVVLAMRWFS
jgi:hypothetical protein